MSVPHLVTICTALGYYLRTHLLQLHGLRIFSTSLPVCKNKNKNNEWGKYAFTNRTETPGNTPPPSFSLKKISAELIAIFIAFLLRCSQFRDQRDGTTGVPDVSNVSDTLVFPLLAHEEKERP